MNENNKTYGSAANRWEGIGPYYAMFPIRFADNVIKEYTSPGDTVIDPFAGRGTAIFSAMALGRRGLGIEISPVGWVYAKTKLKPAPLEQVEERLIEIAEQSKQDETETNLLPDFFNKCFSRSVLQFLLAARKGLDWRKRTCDRTLMAFLLVYLHGKEGQALSNQMRQTKAMSPKYAIKWWDANGKQPPNYNVIDFLSKRIKWRYEKGIVQANGSQILLGNSIKLIPKVEERLRIQDSPKATLLLTSPPYYDFTNYHYDQWLRLWLLGYETNAYVSRGPYRGRFTNRKKYQYLLTTVFTRASRIVKEEAVIYIRTTNDKITKEATLNALKEAFPQKRLIEQDQPFLKPTQTHLFGNKTLKAGEVDLILLPTTVDRTNKVKYKLSLNTQCK